MDAIPFLASHKDCTGCLACVDACPVNALRSIIAGDGHIYPDCDFDKCLNCGKCSRVCPILGKAYIYRSESVPSFYAAWCTDKALRQESASGGVFASLAFYVIEKGGVVFGAAIDGLTVKHICIDKRDDISLLQGSKYQQSDMTGIYRSVKSYLLNGRLVLFSGSPCQVSALYSYLGNREYANLLTLDMICSGFPSLLPLKRFVVDTSSDKIISFRDKKRGWSSTNYKANFVVQSGEKIVEYGYNNLVMRAFASMLTHRYSCYNCHYSTLQHRADITVGDFWGDKKMVEQHQMGLSVMIVQSPVKMEPILRECSLSYTEIGLSDFLYSNPRYVTNRRYLIYHPVRQLMVSMFKRLKTNTILHMYGDASNLFWFIYKGANVLVQRIDDKFNKRKIKNIISRYGKN